MTDRIRIKKLLKELELTTFKEITPILLKFGFDRQRAKSFLDSIIQLNLIEIQHNGDIKWIYLQGKLVLLENLNIGAKMTLVGEKYLHENLTFFEKIKSEWWKLILVNIPGIIFGALLTLMISNSSDKAENNQSTTEDISKDSTSIIELTEFKNGRWISLTDSLAGIEIKNGKWIMFYKGMETDSTDIYDFKIQREYFKEIVTEHKPIEYLTITNQSDTLKYSILEYSQESLSLIYMPRGNTLNYKPEK
ncbi:MAG: hypothetical protein ACPG6G_05495 [Flavobacteriaceae bacterium]